MKKGVLAAPAIRQFSLRKAIAPAIAHGATFSSWSSSSSYSAIMIIIIIIIPTSKRPECPPGTRQYNTPRCMYAIGIAKYLDLIYPAPSWPTQHLPNVPSTFLTSEGVRSKPADLTGLYAQNKSMVTNLNNPLKVSSFSIIFGQFSLERKGLQSITEYCRVSYQSII